MRAITSVILNRNSLLVLAVILGLVFGEKAGVLQDYTLYILGTVMAFSLTGIKNNSLLPLRNLFIPFLSGIVLNYLVFGTVLILMTVLFINDNDLFLGFMAIAAAPPGVGIIPFTQMLGGDLKYSMLGVFGAFLGSLILAPLILWIFASGQEISILDYAILMVQMVMIPFIISRILIIPRIFKVAEKIRGQVANWGFALIIFAAVGINSHIFIADFNILLAVSSVLVISIFGLGIIYSLILKALSVGYEKRLSRIMLATLKSSGFSAATAFTLFGNKAAVPSAVMSVVVLMFFLYLSFTSDQAGHS